MVYNQAAMDTQENGAKRAKSTFFIVLIIVGIITAAFYYWYNKEYTPLTEPKLEVTLGESEQGPVNDAFTDPENPEAGANEVLIYYVDIGNKRKSKETIGCGDSVVPVTVSALVSNKNAQEMIGTALGILFNQKDQFIGKSGLYNSLYQSNLKLEKVEIVQGIAKIYLTGELKLGGTCDSPRFEQQIQYTVKQFEVVRKAEIFLNNAPLNLSQK